MTQVWEHERQEEFFRASKSITLIEATEFCGLAYSTLAQAAREHRIEAWRSGATWLTTRQAIETAIEQGALRPRTAKLVD